MYQRGCHWTDFRKNMLLGGGGGLGQIIIIIKKKVKIGEKYRGTVCEDIRTFSYCCYSIVVIKFAIKAIFVRSLDIIVLLTVTYSSAVQFHLQQMG